MDNPIPRITKERIDALMATVTYRYWVIAGTTTTICAAMLDGKFNLARGFSACVDERLYNQEVGEELARKDAESQARNKLWELEGYALYRRLKDEPEQIARLTYLVNKAYCESMGDNSFTSWEEAPDWQKNSNRMGVALHLNGEHGPEASHGSWMAQKLSEGWSYGPEKNPELKQHPCLVAFKDLSPEQQAKDYIFRGVVHAFKKGGM